MKWTHEIIMEFLDLYEQEPTIWNPLNQDHNDRDKVYDAWKRIQMNFSLECSMKDLKRKKDNLMATYRKLSLKAKKSGNTGSATEVFKPEWFAYEKMASFLYTVYAPRGTKTTAVEIPDDGHYIDDDDIAMNNEDETPSIVTDQDNSSTASNTIESEGQGSPVTKGGPPLGKKRKFEQVAHIGKRRDDAYHFLQQVATKPKPTKDESALFCDLLCVKLQALDDETRAIAMHEINNLMFSYRKSKTRFR